MYAITGVLVAACSFFFIAPPALDAIANRLTSAAPPAPSERALRLHQELWIADLHADSLMWNRDPLERNARGLVDIPRLIEGGVALQAFTVVSKVPWGMNVHSNPSSGDMLTPLVVAQRWPLPTWSSLLQRALYQAARLHQAAAASGGAFSVITSGADLAAYRRRRAEDPHSTAGLLGIEGAQVLEGELANLRRLYDAGFRMLAPAHFFDTEVGGSTHGEHKTGLTPLGAEVIDEMRRLGMIVDLSHASARTIDDVLDTPGVPVVFSHTGVKGTCDTPRNLSDAQLRRAARHGALIGIGFFSGATCRDDVEGIVKAIRYTARTIGVKHVALGSDWDGFVRTPFDAAGLPALTDALLRSGFSEDEVAAIMGGNVLSLLERVLPGN